MGSSLATTGQQVVMPLAAADQGVAHLVGGKAANLGELIAAGEAVPDGFCVTTVAYRDTVRPAGKLDALLAGLDKISPDDRERLASLAAQACDEVLTAQFPDELNDAITTAYGRLGGDREVSVAVRSSATAEDLPDASFAGQQDTYLGVTGAANVVDAVRRCWASLWTERAVGYRAANGIDHRAVALAVVVQLMVDADVSGVLFTASPVTGKRTEMVVDATRGLGEALVSGSVDADHYVLGEPDPAPRGCLTAAQLEQLREVGGRLARHFGAPQDVEWSFDGDGRLWVLQSRPVTTLFPLPETDRPGTRVYLSVSAVQGVLQPLTPMGMSVLRMSGAAMWEMVRLPVDPYLGPAGFVDVGGRMYVDATAMMRSKAMRKDLETRMQLHGPRAAAGVARLLDDPRFAPKRGLPFRTRSVAKVVAQLAVPCVVSFGRGLVRPHAARARAHRLAAEIERCSTARPGDRTAAQRLAFVYAATREIMNRRMMDLVFVLYAGMVASALPGPLLGRHAGPGEVEAVLRGMPYNPTTEMDLELWRLTQRVGESRELLLSTPPAVLARRYVAGELPDLGLEEFLAKYGRRAAAEIDVGVPRWAEDPAPVFAVIANYLRSTDSEQAPDVRFSRAAAEAEAKIDELVRRARRQRPVRARLAGFLLRRARETAGLRELPKFCILHGLRHVREQLLSVGAELVDRGLLDRADDIMFLDFPEARTAVAGRDLRAVVAERKARHQREMRRRHVPTVLLSDGTDPEAQPSAWPAPDGSLTGMPAAPGRVTGPARVLCDPSTAQVEPGEIIVAPSTDPGWTPLFLTAGGLVTETGATNSHGPTVAREYGIPAVIGVPAVTDEIRTGDLITVDGAAGTVTAADGPGPAATRKQC